MADENAKTDPLGWGKQIVFVYETFFLRDVLGYIFPGAVLLFGLVRLGCTDCRMLNPHDWPSVLVGLCAAYSAGVFVRLLGTSTRILVIGPVEGLFGDPWDLKTDARANRLWRETLWKSPYNSEAAL